MQLFGRLTRTVEEDLKIEGAVENGASDDPRDQATRHADCSACYHSDTRQPRPEHGEDNGGYGGPDQDAHEVIHCVQIHL